MLLTSLVASLAWVAPALAAPDDAVDVAPMEVVVVDQPFARWDDTRWVIKAQTRMPFPVPLYAEDNHEVQVVAVDLRTVVHCSLGEFITRQRRDIDCVIEDAAITGAPWHREAPHALAVLEETDARLTGMHVRLQATADGKVGSLKIVDAPERNRRVSILYENLRQLVGRSLVGFHLSAPSNFVLGQQWTEKNSEVLSMPSFRFVPAFVGPTPDVGGGPSSADGVEPSGSATFAVAAQPLPLPLTSRLAPGGRNSFDALVAPKSFGFNVIAHRMDPYDGHYLVQSAGEGTVSLGDELQVTYKGTVDAVSVFRVSDAVMTERVWNVELTPTAGSALADGVAGWPYQATGSLRMLGRNEHPDLGASRVVAPPNTARGQLPPWPAL